MMAKKRARISVCAAVQQTKRNENVVKMGTTDHYIVLDKVAIKTNERKTKEKNR